jgi:ribosomal protein S27E
MGILTCRVCQMTIESEGIDDNNQWVCAGCENPSTGQPPTTRHLPNILTPEPIVVHRPPVACPQCAYSMIAPKDKSSRFSCPSCKQTLSYDSAGQLQVHDDFKEFLKNRAKQQRTAPTRRPAESKTETVEEAEPETEEEEERAPAGLIYSFVCFPLLAAFGLSFWPDAYKAVEQFLKPVVKLLGL